MTAVPLPKDICLSEDETTNLFPYKDIRKNLEKEFVTPLVRQRLSRMSNQAYVSTSDFMKVYLRVRPLTDAEKECNEDQKCLQISKDNHILTLNAPKDSSKFKASSHGIGDKMQNFSFTKIFHPETGQKEFFDATALKFVEDFIGGQNALLFTYGVTSSGKTYTIQGSPGSEGIMPRAVDVVFNSIGGLIAEESNITLQMANKVVLVSEKEKLELLQEKKEVLALADQNELEFSQADSLDISIEASMSDLSETTKSHSISSSVNDTKRLSFLEFSQNVTDDSFVDISAQGPVRYVVFVSFIEIYNEYIYDLLKPMPKGKGQRRTVLRLAEDQSLPFVKGLREIQVSTREEVFKLLTVGRNHLHMAETKLNQNSSRSHCIFTIKSVCTKEDGAKPLTARVSQLSFCDLAGSERWAKTNSYGERLKEAGKIHTSLHTLGKCIETLRYNQQHRNNPRLVPYRESRLTRLFQTFLKGHGKACMIVNVNQCASMFDETAHALKYSAIASEIRIPDKPLNAAGRMSFRKSKGISQNAVVKNKSSFDQQSRSRSGWEPNATPIKEEESDNNEEERDDDDDQEEIEHDNAYWQARENKFVEVIKLLQKALRDEKENCYITERDVRAELVEDMKRQVVYVEEKWEARLERELKDTEDYSHKRLKDTVDHANRKIQYLLDAKESLEKQVKDLDEECDELDQKMDAKVLEHEKEIKELNDKLAEAQKAVEEKESKVMQNNKEKVTSDQSLMNEECQKLVESLQQENEDGREIIKEQLQQLEEMRDLIEKGQLENENLTKLKKELEASLEEMKQEKEKFEKENTGLKDTINSLKNDTDSFVKSAEISNKAIETLKEENTEVNTKHQDLKSALNEALACAEMKNAEIKKLDTELLKVYEQLSEKQTALEKIKDEKEQVISTLRSLEENMKENDLKHREELQNLSKSQDESLEKLKHEHQEDIKNVQEKFEEECTGLKATINSLKNEKESFLKSAEISSKAAETLKEEKAEVDAKYQELKSALNEALVCAEMKNAEVEKLDTELLKTRKQLSEKQRELDKIKDGKEQMMSNLQSLKEEREACDVKQREELKSLSKSLDHRLEKLKQEHEKELKDLEKVYKKEKLAIESTVKSANDEAEEARKELAIANNLEKQLMSEIERTQAEVKKLESDKLNEVQQSKKRTSETLELAQDIHILTMERDDLLKTVEQLEKKLTKVTKENLVLENNKSTSTVAEASELETLKVRMNEMDNTRTKNEALIHRQQTEIDEKKTLLIELEEKIEMLSKAKQDLTLEVAEISESRDSAESLRSEIALALSERDQEIKAQEAKLLLQERELMRVSEKMKEKDQKIETLQQEVEEELESKQTQLKKFREGRNRIAAALEMQINTQKSCNRVLKDKLDAQNETNVKLQSENSRLKAELNITKSQTIKLRKSVSASAILKPIKLEVNSEDNLKELDNVASKTSPTSDEVPECNFKVQHEESLKKDTSVMVTMLDMSTTTGGTPIPTSPVKEDEEEDRDDKQESQDQTEVCGRSLRSRSCASNRKPVVKKKSSRRKRGTTSNRPDTPIATVRYSTADESAPEAAVLPNKRRTRTTDVVLSSDVNVKIQPKETIDDITENVTDEVLDDSELLRVTGHSQHFPKSEMEIDVTPQLKKRKTRKRTNKQKDEVKNDATLRGGPKEFASRLAKRLKAADKLFHVEQPNPDDDRCSVRGRTKKRIKPNVDSIEDQENTSKGKNMARMGNILMNSPVGQALKKIEAAISPSKPTVISSPRQTALTYNDPLRQSTRRVRKLHADDISLPLESTPDEQSMIGTVKRGVGVLTQTQNASVSRASTRKLRKRK